MSKPKIQPRKSEPAPSTRVPSTGIPPTARKSSSPAINSQNAAAVPRFYDGPTVSAKSDPNDRAKAVASKAAAVTKASGKKVVAKAKRHPWSIVSILTTIPFLIVFSLTSTVLCPPPGEPSTLNRYLLSPLGYQPHQSHPVLCYPANVYHREVLRPYVYPFIDDLHHKLSTHPTYTTYVEPATNQVRSAGYKAWNGPIKPVVNRTVRGAKRFYFTFIQPHIPYVKARINAVTAPYTSRISAIAAPHIATANAYANVASQNAAKGYNYAAAHPLTDKANQYAQRGYKIGSERSQQAYAWSKPRLLRARLELQRITMEVLGPRAVKGIQHATIRAAKIEAAVRAQIVKLYLTHLEPHVGPYVNKASLAIAPYTALFHKHVHAPYIKPTVDHFFPPSAESKSFIAMLADFLPSGSSHAAERKGQMDDYYQDIEHARKPADVKVPQADKVAEKKAPIVEASKGEKKERKETKKLEKAEMERVRDAIKTRVEEQGKKGLKVAKEEIKQLQVKFNNDDLPKLTQNIRSEVEREIDYIHRGLDKLYTSSPSLTREQVHKSGDQADFRLRKTTDKIKVRLDRLKTRLYDDGKAAAQKQSAALDQALGEEYEELGQQMKWIDDLTSKDWDKYNEVKKAADNWKTKYNALYEDSSLVKPFGELKTEMNDYHESFRDRIGILKRAALDRIAAREAMSEEPSRVSILPVKEAASAAAGIIGAGAAGAIIGKGKEQVISALSQANAAAVGESATATGVVDQARASAESAYEAAASTIHELSRSVASAVGATPSPETPREHVESVVNVASEGIESFVDAATSSVHQATRSAMKAVGVTPSPESLAEHAESAYAAAAEAVDSLSSAAESVIHDATRSVVKAVGGTPSPESPREHAESIYNAAGDAANSLAGSASEGLHQATRSAMSAAGATPSPETFGESVESVLAAASEGVAGVIPNIDVSSAVHDATRSVIRAVGATPSPETPGEHLESLSYAASVSASSAVSAANEAIANYAGDASAAIHDATRSVYAAVGGTPSPESAQEYLESIANVVAGGAASVYGVVGDNAASAYDAAGSQVHDATRSAMKAVGVTPSPETPAEHAASLANAASSAVHDATRSAMRAVGVTPSPETPGEYAESIYDAASSGASSVSSVVSAEVASVVLQIQDALGLVPTPTPEQLASSASAYLASIAGVGASLGADALSSGSSILASLQTEIHSATRSASKALGATPTPETAGDYLEAAKEKIRNPREIAESLVKKHAAQISRDLESERAAGTTRIIGDEHGHGHAHTRGAHAHAHPAQDEL
ncbi:hypothetical protein I317_05200 [Kwoniella heveanensis CBS 569]|nr:hypothetical protein I317_05200 [Kwoniella heveanensis CBS 569]